MFARNFRAACRKAMPGPRSGATRIGAPGPSTSRPWKRRGALESRYGVSYWDALMLAAAQQQGCAVMLTEDLQHQQVMDEMQIINPFLVGPELLDATT